MKRHASLAVICITTLTMATFGAGLPNEEPLWPNGVPGKAIIAHKQPEKNTLKVDEKTGKFGGGASFVSTPTLMIFPAARAKATRTAVVVFPGGGYRNVALGKEGVAIAQRLNEMGITAIVVKYRTLALADPNIRTDAEINAQVPTIVGDGIRAVRIVRSRAAELGVDPNKIGVMGFSAGANISASIMVSADAGTRNATDVVARASSRPDFTCMVYGGLWPDRYAGINSGAGPCFLAIAADDIKVDPNRVLGIFGVLRKAGVKTELHVYQTGGHGFGTGRPGETNAMWMEEFGAWLRQNGFARP
jgi:acetyl esterase/lipase